MTRSRWLLLLGVLLVQHVLAQQPAPKEVGRIAPSRVSNTNDLPEIWNAILTATNAWALTIRQTEGWASVLEATPEQLQAKATQGIAIAQLKLGFDRLTAARSPTDYTNAVSELTRAAKQGLAPAEFLLGEACLKGVGTSENFAAAVEWLDKAATQGLADAQFLLGLCYLRGGPGVNQAPGRGLKWVQRAAEQGRSIAQQFVGECYAAGEAVTPDPVEAARWYSRAADQGLATAQDLLAGCYLNGRGVTKDPQEAVNWYRRAADQGLPVAQDNLARCYARGSGVATNAAEAAQWWRKAAASGYPSARFHLGLCYYEGYGLAKDTEQAVNCFRQEAEHGHVGAQLYLGLCFWRGEGVAQEAAEAKKLWADACIQGIVPWRYAIGEEGLSDAEEVETWWRYVAERATASLQCCLAEAYHFGHGVSADDSQAVQWYRKAADQGDLVALKRVCWLLSTSPNPKIRDGTSAVQFGEKAAAITLSKDSSILDTLAAAYAEANRFDRAIQTEKQAIALAQRDDEKQEYQGRLKLYQARTPFRASQ